MINIDYTNMMASAVPSGVTPETWSAFEEKFKGAQAGFAKLVDSGEVGFSEIAANKTLAESVVAFAKSVEGRFSDVVVLGIGGSALGPIALRTALCADHWNLRSKEQRAGQPRLHVLDNVDPVSISGLLDILNIPDTLFVVISKSGGTAETMSQFLIAYDAVASRNLNPASHFVFVTDPSSGALRKLADELKIPALEIPSNVGGRFSVLTPVGTLPAALVGVDLNELLRGAAEMADRCLSPSLRDNPAGIFAALQYLSDTDLGRHIHVLMPYSDELRDVANWFVQLWSESLGKVDSAGRHVGPTPLPALGATDQHSQVQLFMEGPADKTITFLSVRQRSVDVVIPKLFDTVPELSYLGGHSLSELINIEQLSTAGALARRDRLNMTIELSKVDAWHIGGLLMMLEIATAYAGQLYQVDAFNQPGVELGKSFAYALLGKPGADDAKAEWDLLPKPDSRWRTNNQ